MSVRTEVLGAPLDDTFEFLSEVNGQARIVRATLLGNNAQWMRRLSKGGDKQEFLADCAHALEEQGLAKRGGMERDDADMCEFCESPLVSALLGGKHTCRVSATFTCPECRGQWSRVQARFHPEDEHVLGQKCKGCRESGNVLRWQFVDAPNDRGQGDERKPHRSDLCEACDSFGNCQGAFFEPFIMSTAIALLTRQSGTQWASSGDVFIANAGRYAVGMLPHVFSASMSRGKRFGDTSSWGSKGRKGSKGGQDGNGKGGKGGKGKTGGKGRCDRRGAGKSDKISGNYGQGGHSVGREQVCRHWKSGHCSYGERCRYLHQ